MSDIITDDSVFREEIVDSSILAPSTLDSPYTVPQATDDQLILETFYKVPVGAGDSSGATFAADSALSSPDSGNVSISTGTDVGQEFSLAGNADIDVPTLHDAGTDARQLEDDQDHGVLDSTDQNDTAASGIIGEPPGDTVQSIGTYSTASVNSAEDSFNVPHDIEDVQAPTPTPGPADASSHASGADSSSTTVTGEAPSGAIQPSDTYSNGPQTEDQFKVPEETNEAAVPTQAADTTTTPPTSQNIEASISSDTVIGEPPGESSEPTSMFPGNPSIEDAFKVPDETSNGPTDAPLSDITTLPQSTPDSTSSQISDVNDRPHTFGGDVPGDAFQPTSTYAVTHAAEDVFKVPEETNNAAAPVPTSGSQPESAPAEPKTTDTDKIATITSGEQPGEPIEPSSGHFGGDSIANAFEVPEETNKGLSPAPTSSPQSVAVFAGSEAPAMDETATTVAGDLPGFTTQTTTQETSMDEHTFEVPEETNEALAATSDSQHTSISQSLPASTSSPTTDTKVNSTSVSGDLPGSTDQISSEGASTIEDGFTVPEDTNKALANDPAANNSQVASTPINTAAVTELITDSVAGDAPGKIAESSVEVGSQTEDAFKVPDETNDANNQPTESVAEEAPQEDSNVDTSNAPSMPIDAEVPSQDAQDTSFVVPADTNQTFGGKDVSSPAPTTSTPANETLSALKPSSGHSDVDESNAPPASAAENNDFHDPAFTVPAETNETIAQDNASTTDSTSNAPIMDIPNAPPASAVENNDFHDPAFTVPAETNEAIAQDNTSTTDSTSNAPTMDSSATTTDNLSAAAFSDGFVVEGTPPTM